MNRIGKAPYPDFAQFFVVRTKVMTPRWHTVRLQLVQFHISSTHNKSQLSSLAIRPDTLLEPKCCRKQVSLVFACFPRLISWGVRDQAYLACKGEDLRQEVQHFFTRYNISSLGVHSEPDMLVIVNLWSQENLKFHLMTHQAHLSICPSYTYRTRFDTCMGYLSKPWGFLKIACDLQ